MKLIYIWTAILILVVLQTGCMKEFLDIKREKSQVIPKTLSDYESIMHHIFMNSFTSHQLGEIGCDDYYLNDQQWQLLSNPISKNGYIWAKEVYEGSSSQDWNRGYEKILYANFVMDGLKEKGFKDDSDKRRVEAKARFFRGSTYFNLAQLFTPQYDEGNAFLANGLPLRTTSNMNVEIGRSSLQETYSLIERDLNYAAHYLSDKVDFKTIPNKTAAYSMLAMLKLQQGQYLATKLYADTAMMSAPALLNYNNINYNSAAPFPNQGLDNIEVIFSSNTSTPTSHSSSRINIDSVLYAYYDKDDIRKFALFSLNADRIIFKSSYVGTNALMFTGITTAEILLMRAECNARLNYLEDAKSDMELLLKNRYFNSVIPNIPTDQIDLIRFILRERRKELLFRGRRWQDLRRYLNDPVFQVFPKRIIDSKILTLTNNDNRWVWPLPPDAISISRFEQNPR